MQNLGSAVNVAMPAKIQVKPDRRRSLSSYRSCPVAATTRSASANYDLGGLVASNGAGVVGTIRNTPVHVCIRWRKFGVPVAASGLRKATACHAQPSFPVHNRTEAARTPPYVIQRLRQHIIVCGNAAPVSSRQGQQTVSGHTHLPFQSVVPDRGSQFSPLALLSRDRVGCLERLRRTQ